MKSQYKIAVLTSGHSRGSNFRAIFNYIKDKNLPIVVDFVLITDSSAPIRAFCEQMGIDIIYYDGQMKINDFLLDIFANKSIDLIVLAGFMRKLSKRFIETVRIPVINIHPALLPKYGGKGMYGNKVHCAVFESGDQCSGATVHHVSCEYDQGQIILQEEVDILDCQSAEEIAQKVLQIEHRIYGKAIEKLLLGED
ncbi:MAG: formyltransferase family protein [Candidatus Cloacimonadales bacterium]|jgi:formyltetrahydrofolate-dependent phosphoribosylglycinamide formyltransferase|nr:phosphoribosylglycinamide formyltransferase [Candidatus Cloacimonadota bacterium]MDD2649606.1 formyltransferase family protein [Candidatus Cloacimonadota bacterium]MDD3501876.1 formyltransferase family protein [Candidatus Cloacimonadota bacterium]MDX9977277.1 formyltransferase family protein [Candidatus Cloacimonadales bacterium]